MIVITRFAQCMSMYLFMVLPSRKGLQYDCNYLICSMSVNVSVYIYILNVATLDETIIPSCLHFSMQNIEPSRGLCRASRWSNVNVN